jgi:hypothetical protein
MDHPDPQNPIPPPFFSVGLRQGERPMAESLKSPYLQKDETRGNYQVWIDDAIEEKERGLCC